MKNRYQNNEAVDMKTNPLIAYQSEDGNISGSCLRLFMYVDEVALENIIRQERLRVSCPWRTNDVTEGVYAGEYSQNEDTKKYGYLCFSAVCNSPAMWGYYANRGRGACLVFDFDVRPLKNGEYEVLKHGLSCVEKSFKILALSHQSVEKSSFLRIGRFFVRTPHFS